MGFNIVAETIEQYLDEVAGNHEEKGLAGLLRQALLRPLRKELARQERADNLEELTALPKGAPGWLRQSFNDKIPVYGFAPRAEMREAIAHIADWLAAALVNKEEWLRDLDDQGRPKKLVKLGSLERVKKEADKAMVLAAQRGAANLYQDEDGHEKTEKVFEGGYRMVRLLTPAALDKESAAMAHCIGQGAYDERLASGTHAYYSLRDPRGKSHATLEVERAGLMQSWFGKKEALLQCQGKENRRPVAKYMPFIQSFVRARKLKLGDASVCKTGLIEQGGEYYDVLNLPEGLTVSGWLDLRGTGITSLPEGLTVGGGLYLWGTGITELPKGLTVGGNLDLGGTGITSLPEGLTVGGGLYLWGTGITSLSEGLTVGGDLDLSGTAITALPEGLKVGGGLDLRGTGIRALPENLKVGGSLDLRGTGITELPKGVTVIGKVYMDKPEAIEWPWQARGADMRPA